MERANGTRQHQMLEGDISSPPHADEIETNLMSELSVLLKKQTALGAQRMSDVLATQRQLQAHLEVTATTADVALQMFTRTLVEVRLFNEEGDKLLKRLTNEHSNLNALTQRQ